MDDPSYLPILLEEVDLNTVWGMPEWLVWLLIAIMLIVSGIFSASENTYTNCNKYHFITKSKDGSFTAKLIVRLIEKFDNTLITVLVGNNIVQTLMSFMSAILFYNMSLKNGWAEGVEAIVSTVVMAALVYVVSDTCPKILSKVIPNKMAYLLAYPVTFTFFLLYPIIFIFKGILLLVHKIFKIKDESLLSKEDIIHKAKLAINDESIDEESENDEKLFEQNEEKLLDNAFDFDKKIVKSIFVPLEKTTMLDLTDLTIDEINQRLIDIPFTRIPIYEKEKTNIIGILVLKTYFEEYVKDKHLSIDSILEDKITIDINTPIDDAFNILNKEKVHLGIVTENDVIKGIVTMEDILEELVEDIDETKVLKIKKEAN